MLAEFVSNHCGLSLVPNVIGHAKKAVVCVASLLLANGHVWFMLLD